MNPLEPLARRLSRLGSSGHIKITPPDAATQTTLAQAFLEQLGIRNGNRDLLNHPGDTCSQGHPFEANNAGECTTCSTGDRNLVEDAADYRTLAAHVIAKLNPDGLFAIDRVEVSICMDAITAITDYVESLRCRCSIKADGSPCARCRALGRQRDEKVQR